MDVDLYYVCEYTSKEEILFSCRDIIECADFSGNGNSYLFALVDSSIPDVDFLLKKEYFIFNTKKFHGNFSVVFSVKKIIKACNILYLYVEAGQGMYKFGALSLLKTIDTNQERSWLNLIGDNKRKYISASYLMYGIHNQIDKDTVTIEGKYIIDYYSFFCEFGYALFGNFGYIGNNIHAFEDCIVNISIAERKLKIIWKDSALSLKAIDNTAPQYLLSQPASELIVMTLSEHCELLLK